MNINYHTLRYHLIKHSEAKLKTPRKSHVKKDDRVIDAFLKLPDVFNQLRGSLDKNKYITINLYFQDESRCGLMSHV